MTIGAETADLTVVLKLKDQLSPGLANIQRKLSGLSGLPGRFGGALKSQLLGPLNLVNLGIAKLSTAIAHMAVDVAEETIRKTTAFGEAVYKLQSLTKGTAEQTSALVDTLDYFGIAAEDQTRLVGMATKNLGNFAANAKASAKFQKEFGFNIFDSKGKVKDFNTILLQSADYFNDKSIPASTKAAALAKIYGRQWQELIPILSQGSAKLKAAESDAIKLSPKDLENMNKFKEASRKWDDALGDLQITVGAKLLPALTKLANRGAKFVTEHSGEIVQFFKDAAKFAERVGKAVQTYVVPAFSALADAWSKVPSDLKKVLVGGFIANKLTGGLVGSLAGGAIKAGAGAAGGLLGRGSTPANPLFVTDVAKDLGGGGVAGQAAGGAGWLTTALKATIIGAVLAIGAEKSVESIFSTKDKFENQGIGSFSQADQATIFKRTGGNAGTNANGALVKAFRDSSQDIVEAVRGKSRGEDRSYDAIEALRNNSRTLSKAEIAATRAAQAKTLAAASRAVAINRQGDERIASAVKHQKPPEVKVTVPVAVSVSGIAQATVSYSKYTRGANNSHGK